MSIICSAANELIELLLKKRAKDLEEGLAELIGDPQNTKTFLAAIYNHGLVNGLYRGSYTPGSSKLPAYIPARNFALALLEIYRDPEINVLPANVKSSMTAFENAAKDDEEKLQKSVEDWYNSAMDRVSGWYKRRTQKFIFVMGIILAVAINADCIAIAKKLSNDASLRQGIVALADAAGKKDPAKDDTKQIELIQQNIKTLDSLGLPIGWPIDQESPKTESASEILNHWWGMATYAIPRHGLGWLLTALAISLGAPFWFDMLNKIMVIRSLVKPHEKSREEGSKDKAKEKSLSASN